MPLFKKLSAWFSAKLLPVSPELTARLARINAWLGQLPVPDARRLALEVIANPDWFETRPPEPGPPPPLSWPPTVRDLFTQYAEVRGRYCDLVLVRADAGPSRVLPQMTRFGYDDAHVELCCQGEADTTFQVATDVAAAEAIEATFPSLYHAIVHVAAVLEYVSPPSPAA